VFDRDNPEWTKTDFAKAVRHKPGTTLLEAATQVRRGRPRLANPKRAVKLRLDADVLASYRKTGRGWQTRMNADLRKAARKLKTG
jgi:uncharacterized protein (DUF4415 family)